MTGTKEKLRNFADRVRCIPAVEGQPTVVDASDAKWLEELATTIGDLEDRDDILTALEAGGVDNWEGYDLALEEI